MLAIRGYEMKLRDLLDETVNRHQEGNCSYTLLAVCPNSVAVMEAAVSAAHDCNAPMLFAATLNQVDRDGGYTGWTPKEFVSQLQELASKYEVSDHLYPCLDHGGPWLKDRHTLEKLTFPATMQEVKESLTACLEAGYQLLHIDPTVDRTLPIGEPPAIQTVIERTVELISYSEAERHRLGLPPIDYEVGTEEVHGGLVDISRLKQYLSGLRQLLGTRGLLATWPRFIVAQLGTDLHTTHFDFEAARQVHQLVTPLGSLIKGHYTDWVENPRDYPRTGVGAANVGPEFTVLECQALQGLETKEREVIDTEAGRSDFYNVLRRTVVHSDRWKKWLNPEEQGVDFASLEPSRRTWLVQTGARYVWVDSEVSKARSKLYENLKGVVPDPRGYVVERIAKAIKKYLHQFGLEDLI
jgi:D-tagatose-1,6-bisphosphate aldolase subunit GatZ/KbaZ